MADPKTAGSLSSLEMLYILQAALHGLPFPTVYGMYNFEGDASLVNFSTLLRFLCSVYILMLRYFTLPSWKLFSNLEEITTQETLGLRWMEKGQDCCLREEQPQISPGSVLDHCTVQPSVHGSK